MRFFFIGLTILFNSGTDQPEQTNASFFDWVQEVLINWTLEEHDYEGNERKG